jgi:hypothetical protein
VTNPERITGIRHAAAPKDPYDPYWIKRGELIDRVCRDPDMHGWDRLTDRLWALVNQIQELPAHSPAGLGVHALAVSMAMAEYWESNAMESGGNETTRMFVETICRFAGVVPYAVDAYPDEHRDRWLAENAVA